MAQMTMYFDHELKSYERGLDMLSKEKYGAARGQFEKSLQTIGDQNSELSANAKYYVAYCAIELFHKDAEFLLKEFISEYPTSNRVTEAWFLLGNYNYRKRDWEDCIAYFNQIDPTDLNPSQGQEFFFKRGYAFYQEDMIEDAANDFFAVRDEASSYFAPSRYYSGHISYLQENFATALEEFLKLVDHDQFGDVVPYYIAQIYYYQSKFDELIQFGEPLVNQKGIKRQTEISRLIGEAWFNKGEYAKAIPFLESFIQRGYNKQKEDYYQLGYAYLKARDYDRAAEYLSKVTYTEDKLAQNALFNLGEAYLKAGKKKYASNAFRQASKMTFEPEIQEEALFTYALLSYELAYDPYESAIAAFKEYIEQYPNTPRALKAYDNLVNIYLTSNNYDAALRSIEEYENPNIRLKDAYQRIAFNRGVDLFQNGNYREAVVYFEKSLVYKNSKKIAAQALYWKGESLFALKEYALANKTYEEFIVSPGAILTPYFNLANYNIGYSFFEQERYSEAPSWYRRYTSLPGEKDGIRLSDAHLRTGDCYFMLNNYRAASDYYQQALRLGKSDVDYALYQSAMTAGLLKNPTEKVNMLEELVEKYPKSRYLDAGYYELGRASIAAGDDDKALKFLNKVIADFPGSSYVRKALVSIGQTYYNRGDNGNALKIFNKIINDYPTYEDTREALVGIRNIYTEMGQPEKYETLISSLSWVNISNVALDSINYQAAENQYFNGDCKEAVEGFNRYLSRFQPAVFGLNARFYRGECLYRMGNEQEAVKDFEDVADQNKNRFSESALIKAARINFKEEDYTTALAYYKRLSLLGETKRNLQEAELGLMRCDFILNNYQGAIASATIVLDNKKLDAQKQVEAMMIIAKSNLQLRNRVEAETYLIDIIEKGGPSAAAEASYLMARIKYNTDSLALAEEMVFGLIENYQSEQEWIARGLILLADIYLTKGDVFQAKATLKSILENYKPEDDIKRMAREKLANVEALEQIELDNAPPDMEIEFNEGSNLDEENDSSERDSDTGLEDDGENVEDESDQTNDDTDE